MRDDEYAQQLLEQRKRERIYFTPQYHRWHEQVRKWLKSDQRFEDVVTEKHPYDKGLCP